MTKYHMMDARAHYERLKRKKKVRDRRMLELILGSIVIAACLILI